MNALHSFRQETYAAENRDKLLLRCPACGSELGSIRPTIAPFGTSMVCSGCSFALDNLRGIWFALPPERQEYYRQFLSEYQVVRAAEGRGSNEASFYLALPFRDLSGKFRSQWSIRAQTYRYIERKLLPELDSRRAGLDILDLGAGNCWLSYRLMLLGHRPVAVDLLVNDTDGLGVASHYLRKLNRLFPRFQAELDSLPFQNAQFDCVIFNASFHYSENYAKTLAESIRCLRRNGIVIIADTPWYGKDESGRRMIRERHAFFQRQFGFPSDSLKSREYLTDRRLQELEKLFGIRWQVHRPNYGLRWAMRPLIARLNRKREPSTFNVYVARLVRT